MSQSLSRGPGRGRGSLKSRLPPIHMLGKHTPVDEDEPPDVPIQAFGFDTDGENSFSSAFETTFDATDADDAAKFLRKTFNILQPGHHACKRVPEMDGGYFNHCPRGVPLGQQYSRLRKLMEERAQLELLKDCLSRVRSAQMFVEELEGLVHMECRTVYAIRHGCGPSETPVTKLYCLNALCEDLRLHVAHWNSIKQRMNTNRWLQPRLGQLCLQLQYIMQVLMSAVLRAVWNLDQLIHIGFEVFAHCNMETLTPEIMWNITRGLEDFNVVVNGLKLNFQLEKSHSFAYSPFSFVHNVHPALLNSSFRKPLRVIPFTKVLNILANEKSRYAAKLTHHFFTANEHFVRMLSTGTMPPFEWGDYLPHQHQPHSQAIHSDTSDYHTFSGSNASLNATFLQVGSVRAPDLSNLGSPLIEFSQKEQEFAENFLLIVCNSTSLLRKNEPQKTHRSRPSNKNSDLKTPLSPVVGRPPRVQFQGETPVMTRTDSHHRKTVSWGDNADNTIRSAVVAHYMDSLWTHLGSNLDLFLDEPAWSNRSCLLQSKMGSVLLFNDTVTAVLRNIIEHVCYKDLFPPTSVQPLLGVVFRLHALSAYGAWDAFLSTSLASEPSDKCQPRPLSGEAFSTRTGQYLRDLFKPLMSILQDISQSLSKDQEDVVQRADVDLGVYAGVTWRMLTTCRVAQSWCSTKVQQSLSSWNVNQFLLLTHTDLKILVDSTKNASYLLQSLKFSSEGLSSRVCDNLSACQVTGLLQQISQTNSQMQSLSGSTTKTFVDKYSAYVTAFFQENMLPSRMWKRKIPPDDQAEANQYTVDILDNLLSPVVRGINYLSAASQISIISMVTVSLCNAWIACILKEKIRFSLWGAVQLGIDFSHVHTKLGAMLENEEVRQSITDLAIFQQMRGIVILLKRQPSQKQPVKLMDSIKPGSTINSTTSPSVATTSAITLGNGAHKSQRALNHPQLSQEEEIDVATVPNMQEWLALRAIGGSKQWKFPACFSRSSSDE
ncbi:uncharacterized protein LOC101846194 isoform X2 [Aplysia californica]|uniref:Uncharacterized protein LOC101846194 isoform X2 n=1 Tax=Aplysia californica TaxID=6500 RepID=A0ABM0JF20_APLCA|nr:uncharacterized protein LOC101846194 isoform X2 [Aplysia californica]